MADLPDLTAVRSAVLELTRAVDDLRRTAGDSMEVRRLTIDAARISEDVDALVGVAPAGPPTDVQPIQIPDGDYPPEFWADASDEGVGRH